MYLFLVLFRFHHSAAAEHRTAPCDFYRWDGLADIPRCIDPEGD